MKSVFILTSLSLMVLSENAISSMLYFKQLKALYPKYTSATCAKTCHDPKRKPPKLNAYGKAFKAANYDLKAIEEADSDGDKVNNITEIKKNTNPGNRAYRP